MTADLKRYSAHKDSGVPWLREVSEHWEVQYLRSLAEMLVSNSDQAQPMIGRIHNKRTEADLPRGPFEATSDGKPAVVEYEPDPDLLDVEQVPLLEDGGIEAFIRREVLPHAPDAWYVPGSLNPNVAETPASCGC